MSDSSRALKVRLGCALALLAAAACGRQAPLDHGAILSAEPLESSDTQASVRAQADEVTATALDTWSRALPAMTSDAPHELLGSGAGADGAADEEQMRHEPVGTTSLTGADMPTSGAPTPTAPPRSASEAAERGALGTTPAPRSTGVPGPVAPTSPAETIDPTR